MVRIHVEVLGPIRVRDATGCDVTPDGELQRRLLALLVLRRGATVTFDAAVDALWPRRPPRDPRAAVQTHLFRLRRSLLDGVVESTATGYRLDPAMIDTDADELAAAVHAGPTADVGSIASVLERWRGPAYPELADVDEALVEAARLEGLRVRAIELCAEARLRAGEVDGLVAELTALADDHPLRERPRELLIDALVAAGQTADALRAYDDFRRQLGDELGIEPSPALAARHAELLRGTAAVRWSPPHRLSVPVTSLIGRDALSAEAAAMVESNRLVTLLGTGGVGKTRLLLDVGRRLRAVRPDRPVVMCELAASTTDTAVDAVAAALTIDPRPDVGSIERVAAVLGDTEAVILLDNCEHVLDPIAELAEHVLASCPDVSVVATSRERLRVAGEQLCPVRPLSTSDDDPASLLFVERARAVRPDFAPGPQHCAAIRDIVQRLDGLPLAIELAAARLHTLDLEEVAAGLDQRFRLLSAGPRTTARHRSLGAAVAWSYDLLPPDLQHVFADVSVFSGEFTVGDAASVCGLTEADAAAGLDQLTERSLVIRRPNRRYALLETLRAFGAERLAVEGRASEVAARHARRQVAWTEQAAQRMLESGHEGVLAEIDAALPDVRVGLDWLIDHDEVDDAGGLAAALFDYGFFRLRPDVLAWAERVSAAGPGGRGVAAPLVWVSCAYAAWMAGDVAEMGVRAARASELSEPAGGDAKARVATLHGTQALFESRLGDAVAWYRRASDLAESPAARLWALATLVLGLGYAGDPGADEVAAEVLAAVGDARTPFAAYAWYCAGEADLSVDILRAQARLARAAEIAEITGTSFVTGAAGTSLASIEVRLGNLVAAADAYRGVIAHWRRAGMWATQWTTLRSIAGLLARLGRLREAAVLTGAVLVTRSGHRMFGEDERALSDLERELRAALGGDDFEAARAEGARLDGDEAVERALRWL
jgi:predicted ATPase/DNA-binding SARP family transcriptional activator